MSKDNDDLINELNDFENGLRDIEKNKPQSSNRDSDGSGKNDLLDGLNNLGHVNRSENENSGSNKQNTDKKPLDELNDLANDVNEDGFQSAFYSLLASGRIVICRPVS